MLTGLTIIIAIVIVLGVVMIVTSEGESLPLTNGMMFATFGATALFWIARVTTPYLRKDAGLLWLYKPISTLPEWVGYVGLAVTAGLLILSVVFLVDDFVHLPRRRKGGNY
ncbi:hypothetical protein FBF28_02625 [Candidatus Saccharibacteria bacterium oral taxon 488]|nr:hypothetical protein FBF28_02625 [Candidatus Saccharibacteria bacterium oral taxon 488]